MNTQQWKSIADLFYSLGVRSYNIGGGEATLRPDLLEILGHLKSKPEPVLTYLSTNGLLLATNPELRRKLIPLIDVIGLSVDGSTAEMNYVMGRTRNHLDANKRLVMALSAEAPSLAVKIGTVVSEVNSSDIQEVGKTISLWNADSPFKLIAWRLFQFSPVEEGLDRRLTYEIPADAFDLIAQETQAAFPEMRIIPRPHSEADNAYFLVLPTGELALVKDGLHQPISEPLPALDLGTLSTLLNQHSETAARGEINRSWLTKEGPI